MTRKTFKDEIDQHEENLLIDKIAQKENEDTWLKHHPVISSLMKPMYDPLQEQSQENKLIAGTKITVGFTQE